MVIVIVYSSASIGRAFQYAPDVAKANVAASTIFNMIHRNSKIDPTIPGGKKMVSFVTKCVAILYCCLLGCVYMAQYILADDACEQQVTGGILWNIKNPPPPPDKERSTKSFTRMYTKRPTACTLYQCTKRSTIITVCLINDATYQ